LLENSFLTFAFSCGTYFFLHNIGQMRRYGERDFHSSSSTNLTVTLSTFLTILREVNILEILFAYKKSRQYVGSLDLLHKHSIRNYL
jgi:hypothetical protein